jgi:uncharacterized protein YutE (UPF0331/DUF86 family)
LVDRALILRKLAELETYLQQIREYEQITVDEYQSDWKTQRIIDRTLQLMIELCMDIANHIISDKQLPVPTSYANAFETLQQAGLISRQLMEITTNMAKFRNILVHQYADVNATTVVSILHSHLVDFILFRDEIVELVK